jgi:pyruvate dehydrogenase E2 component (dihydrolipoamide acetyltransferase)
MASAVVLPKQGQTVESCILVEWKKQPGEQVDEGDVLCEVETDKAVLEVPSPVAGTLLAHFFAVGDDVPVLTTIAAIGAAGEGVDDLRPAGATTEAPATRTIPAQPAQPILPTPTPVATTEDAPPGVSPRARRLATQHGVDAPALHGSGPGGRVIERDVLAAVAEQPKLSPVAQAMVTRGGFARPAQGSGPGGRIMARDVTEGAQAEALPAQPDAAPVDLSAPAAMAAGVTASVMEEEGEVTPVRGVRKVIAERMLASLQSTAQLTLHSSADARALLSLRKRFKASDPDLGLQGVTLNDLLLFAVARSLPHHPLLNATYSDNTLRRLQAVHLGFAVDTPRGLLVPVIRHAQALSLRALAQEGKRLASAALAGTIQPDEMVGGTFTVTNLGNLGIEQFTPILNVPQVAILGVGNILPKAVYLAGDDEQVTFVPHMGLSLTINHQVVDGAPGARFLQALAANLRQIDLLLAI